MVMTTQHLHCVASRKSYLYPLHQNIAPRLRAYLVVLNFQTTPNGSNITSADGFVDYYLFMRDLYNTQLEAYEHLEAYHIAITGKV